MATLLQAQPSVYFVNGDRLNNARISEITDTKITLWVLIDDLEKEYQFSRSNMLLAFDGGGNFLIIEELSANLKQARQQVGNFLKANPRSFSSDLLLRLSPVAVIPAHISHETPEIINYQTPAGNAASIRKEELLGVLYKDGRHELYQHTPDIIPKLIEVRKQLRSEERPTASSAVASLSVESARKESRNNSSVNTAKKPVRKATSALTPEQQAQYRSKALRHVSQFLSYLSIITDNAQSDEDKNNAILRASRLFVPAATIEVTSKSRPGLRKYSVREYLTRLKLLSYLSVDVSWADIEYVQDLTPTADGGYTGLIAGQQSFTGYGQGKKIIYSDLTRKNVRVRVEPRDELSTSSGESWQVLLGNIGVTTN